MEYDKKYFKKHFGNPIYKHYIKMRNNQIKKEVLKIKKGGEFLDIGFGDDNLIKIFEDYFEVFGTDISDFAIKEIQKKYKKENFKLCDISQKEIPFPKKFDVICAINTVEHLESPEFAIKNIYDALKSGGIFAFYMPTKGNPLSKTQYKILYNVKEHVFRPSPKKLRKILKKIGFKFIKEYSAGFFPLKIKNRSTINSFNLYFAIFQK